MLRSIRWLIYALLYNVILNVLGVSILGVGQLGGYNAMLIGFNLCVSVLALAATVFGLVAVVALANELNGVAAAVICGILMFVPCISLIVLLKVNGTATDFLQSRGVKVGLMGVNRDAL